MCAHSYTKCISIYIFLVDCVLCADALQSLTKTSFWVCAIRPTNQKYIRSKTDRFSASTFCVFITYISTTAK